MGKCKALKDLGIVKFKVDEGVQDDEEDVPLPFLPPEIRKKMLEKIKEEKERKAKNANKKIATLYSL